MHTGPMSDHDGDFGDAKPCDRRCPRKKDGAVCGGAMTVQVWESHCGGYEDHRFTCTSCGKVVWVDGIDS